MWQPRRLIARSASIDRRLTTRRTTATARNVFIDCIVDYGGRTKRNSIVFLNRSRLVRCSVFCSQLSHSRGILALLRILAEWVQKPKWSRGLVLKLWPTWAWLPWVSSMPKLDFVQTHCKGFPFDLLACLPSLLSAFYLTATFRRRRLGAKCPCKLKSLIISGGRKREKSERNEPQWCKIEPTAGEGGKLRTEFGGRDNLLIHLDYIQCTR